LLFFWDGTAGGPALSAAKQMGAIQKQGKKGLGEFPNTILAGHENQGSTFKPRPKRHRRTKQLNLTKKETPERGITNGKGCYASGGRRMRPSQTRKKVLPTRECEKLFQQKNGGVKYILQSGKGEHCRSGEVPGGGGNQGAKKGQVKNSNRDQKWGGGASIKGMGSNFLPGGKIHHSQLIQRAEGQFCRRRTLLRKVDIENKHRIPSETVQKRTEAKPQNTKRGATNFKGIRSPEKAPGKKSRGARGGPQGVLLGK